MRSERIDLALAAPSSGLASAVARAARALTGADAAGVLCYEGDRARMLAVDPPGADVPLAPGPGAQLLAAAVGDVRGALLLHRPQRPVDGPLREDLVLLVQTCLVQLVNAETEEALTGLQRQLAHTERMSLLGSMISGIVHEIRTPLTYLATNLYLLQRDLEETRAADPPRQRVVEALDGVDRINHLLSEVRRFARRDPRDAAAVALHEAVGEAVDLFRATRRGHFDVAADLRPTPGVPCDRREVQQVVLNLLNNAAEAMPRGGRIQVATRPVEGGAELTVEDGGAGIPPEVQARVFDEFFTTKPTGTGLGLAIVRRIVQARGGTIAFDTRPGKGTTFRVRFVAARGA